MTAERNDVPVGPGGGNTRRSGQTGSRGIGVSASALPALGLVRAEGPGSDRPVQVTAELGIVVRDSRDCLTDPALDRDPGALGHGADPASASTQTDRPCYVLSQGVELAPQAGRAAYVGVALGFVDLTAQIGDTPTIGIPCPSVDKLTRVPEVDGRARRAGRPTGQVEHVNLLARRLD